MLKKKPYIQEHKIEAENRLAARVEALQSKGMQEKQIQRDAQVRHFKGRIRQTMHQLAGIAELERAMARKAEIKAEKLAAPKADQPKKRQAPDPDRKKARKEKKAAVEAEA